MRFMQPADSPETHAANRVFKSYGFRAAVEPGDYFSKRRLKQNSEKNKPDVFRYC